MQVGEDQVKMDLISARVQMQGKEKELVFVFGTFFTVCIDCLHYFINITKGIKKSLAATILLSIRIFRIACVHIQLYIF